MHCVRVSRSDSGARFRVVITSVTGFISVFVLLFLKLRVGAWPSVYRSIPMLLAIDWFRLRFPKARKGPITVFLRVFQRGYPPNAHAAAWLVIVWDALRLAGRALWHIGSLIFLRS